MGVVPTATPGHGIRNLREVILTGNTFLPVNLGPCLSRPMRVSGGLEGPQYVVWAGYWATILPWSGRPGGRLPRSI